MHACPWQHSTCVQAPEHDSRDTRTHNTYRQSHGYWPGREFDATAQQRLDHSTASQLACRRDLGSIICHCGQYEQPCVFSAQHPQLEPSGSKPEVLHGTSLQDGLQQVCNTHRYLCMWRRCGLAGTEGSAQGWLGAVPLPAERYPTTDRGWLPAAVAAAITPQTDMHTQTLLPPKKLSQQHSQHQTIQVTHHLSRPPGPDPPGTDMQQPTTSLNPGSPCHMPTPRIRSKAAN